MLLRDLISALQIRCHRASDSHLAHAYAIVKVYITFAGGFHPVLCGYDNPGNSPLQMHGRSDSRTGVQQARQKQYRSATRVCGQDRIWQSRSSKGQCGVCVCGSPEEMRGGRRVLQWGITTVSTRFWSVLLQIDPVQPDRDAPSITVRNRTVINNNQSSCVHVVIVVLTLSVTAGVSPTVNGGGVCG